MNKTKIIWTEETWNPNSGCVVLSEGCKFCYAKELAEGKRGTPAFPNGFDLTLRPHKLREPGRLKKPSLIFVNSMSDLFWDQIPESYVDQVVDVIRNHPQHQFQVLTKRPERMRDYFYRRIHSRQTLDRVPANFWAGTTIENNRWVERANYLREMLAMDIGLEVTFISAEPLLGQLDDLDLTGIHWVISGGESGRHLMDKPTRKRRAMVDRVGSGGPLWVAREDRMPWVRHLRDLCLSTPISGGRNLTPGLDHVAFFHKQWGGVRPTSGGRILDGRTWDEFPRLPVSGDLWDNAALREEMV